VHGARRPGKHRKKTKKKGKEKGKRRRVVVDFLELRWRRRETRDGEPRSFSSDLPHKQV